MKSKHLAKVDISILEIEKNTNKNNYLNSLNMEKYHCIYFKP